MWTISCVIIIYVPSDTHIEFLPTLLPNWWWNICYVCLRICATAVGKNMDGHSNLWFYDPLLFHSETERPYLENSVHTAQWLFTMYYSACVVYRNYYEKFSS